MCYAIRWFKCELKPPKNQEKMQAYPKAFLQQFFRRKRWGTRLHLPQVQTIRSQGLQQRSLQPKIPPPRLRPILWADWSRFAQLEVNSVHSPQKRVTFADFVSIPHPDIPVGGRLQHFRKQWESVTSDPEILKMVSGFSLPLIDFE